MLRLVGNSFNRVTVSRHADLCFHQARPISRLCCRPSQCGVNRNTTNLHSRPSMRCASVHSQEQAEQDEHSIHQITLLLGLSMSLLAIPLWSRTPAALLVPIFLILYPGTSQLLRPSLKEGFSMILSAAKWCIQHQTPSAQQQQQQLEQQQMQQPQHFHRQQLQHGPQQQYPNQQYPPRFQQQASPQHWQQQQPPQQQQQQQPHRRQQVAQTQSQNCQQQQQQPRELFVNAEFSPVRCDPKSPGNIYYYEPRPQPASFTGAGSYSSQPREASLINPSVPSTLPRIFPPAEPRFTHPAQPWHGSTPNQQTQQAYTQQQEQQQTQYGRTSDNIYRRDNRYASAVAEVTNPRVEELHRVWQLPDTASEDDTEGYRPYSRYQKRPSN